MLDFDSIMNKMADGPSAVVNNKMQFDQEARVPAPVIPIKKKAHFTAKQVAHFALVREAKGLPPVDRIQWLCEKLAEGVTFDGCGHPQCQLGIYVGTQYVRRCNHCRGAGEVTAEQAEINQRYADVKRKGIQRTTYRDHNDSNHYAYNPVC